jgi:hypothetical protein
LGSRKVRFRGSVVRALPFLLSLLLLGQGKAGADNNPFFNVPSTTGGAEASWLGLYLPTNNLDAGPKAVGYPNAPGAMINLYGAGAVAGNDKMLLSLEGFNGSAAASDLQGRHSLWNLDLAGGELEQRYQDGSFEMTTGVAAWWVNYAVELRDSNGAFSRFDSTFPGGGLTGAVRWPSKSHLCFFVRTGYFWFPVSGKWQGSLADQLPKGGFSLNTTFTQAGFDLLF